MASLCFVEWRAGRPGVRGVVQAQAGDAGACRVENNRARPRPRAENNEARPRPRAENNEAWPRPRAENNEARPQPRAENRLVAFLYKVVQLVKGKHLF